jgi:hypothetical protein
MATPSLKKKWRMSWRDRWRIAAGADGSRIALGQTEAGRYLRVIYVADPTPGSVFVITAYELGEKARKALRRRQKSSQRKKP